MTELQLQRFIDANGIELKWNGNELSALVYYGFLHGFVKLIGEVLLFENDIEAILLENYACIDLVPICEYYDIFPENILIKQN
jgi:hypothetical protein